MDFRQNVPRYRNIILIFSESQINDVYLVKFIQTCCATLTFPAVFGKSHVTSNPRVKKKQFDIFT